MNDIKVFITVEVEKEDVKDKGGMSQKTYSKLMDVIDAIRKEDIPVQYKETDMPRRE